MNDERPNLKSVTRGAVIRYLADQGWSRQISRDGSLVKLTLPGAADSDAVNLIFSNEAAPEQERGEVARAGETIVQLYETTASQMARTLASLAYDLIFTRIPDEYVRHDSIELGTARSYLKGMRGLLAASATTELSGERSFKRTRKEALAYANACRFGHTFPGSFGLVVESPVGMNDSPQLETIEADVPFERKVVQRMARGLASYRAAVVNEDPSLIVAAEGGFSANMCDEVVGLIEDTGVSKFEMSISLSPEWESNDISNLVTQPFRIEKRYVEILKDAANSMRKEDRPKPEKVIGRIIRLETDGNPSDLLDDGELDRLW